MSDELFSREPTQAHPAPISHAPLSRKQKAVVGYLDLNKSITLAQAVALVGGNIYANAEKHVGAFLSNMVRRGLIVRVRPGLFARP